MGRSKGTFDVLSARFVVAITMIVVFLIACTSPDPSGDVSAGHGGPDAVEVTAVDGAFEPDRLELTAGDRVELEVTNEGSGAHNFTIEELGLSTGAIEAGGVATARFVVPDDETTFVCTPHPGMEGVIVGAE